MSATICHAIADALAHATAWESATLESREQRVESREQRAEGRGTCRFGLTRHSLRSWLVSDFPYPTHSVVTQELKSESQLQTARDRVAALSHAPRRSSAMDYLEAAKVEWMRVPGFDGGPEHFMAAAQTMALIDIAESLRKIAGVPITPDPEDPPVDEVEWWIDTEQQRITEPTETEGASA